MLTSQGVQVNNPGILDAFTKKSSCDSGCLEAPVLELLVVLFDYERLRGVPLPVMRISYMISIYPLQSKGHILNHLVVKSLPDFIPQILSTFVLLLQWG